MRQNTEQTTPITAKRQSHDVVAEALNRITQLAWHRTYQLRLPEDNDGYEAYVRPSSAEILCTSLDNLLKRYGLKTKSSNPIRVKMLNDHLTALLIPHDIASSTPFMEMVWNINYDRNKLLT